MVLRRCFVPLLLAGAMACSAAAAAAPMTLAQADTGAAEADVVTVEPVPAAEPPPPAPITDASAPEEALERLLADARASMPEACEAEERTALLRVLCTDTLRVGIRGNYPLFATLQDDDRVGYDTDVGRALADWLGVTHEWVYVRAATRISTLAEGGADVVVATMGHNTRRDPQARFIRPHYYRSQTIVVGPKGTEVGGFEDLYGRSVCTTIGNYANSNIVSHNVALMLFEYASRLPEALEDGSCRLAAHDDSFFASFLADPEFSDDFDVKFGFDPVPWGMAVANEDAEDLAHALELISQIMHRDGEFLAIAEKHGIFTEFLEQQQALWRTPVCAAIGALKDPACVAPALNATAEPTAFADQVTAVTEFMKRTIGVAPALPMLMSQPAWELFQAGIINSLVLVIGALAATLVLALVVGVMAGSRYRVLRIPAWFVIVTLQSSPVVLTLVVASAVATALFTYSAAVALGAAIVALGLMNGCNAGQAIGEAMDSLRAEGRTERVFSAAVGRSLTQILSFLVNAAKGTPIASITGAPELLSALTDITSFAAGRVTTYTLVLVFYVAVVMVVVWACNRVRTRLANSSAFA